MTMSGGVVAGIGAVATDRLVYVDSPFAYGKGRVLKQQQAYGGNIATALAAVVSLGGEAQFLGALPDREKWSGLHEDLDGLGVNVSHADVISGGDPIQSTILVASDGDRFIAFDARATVGATPRLDVAALTETDTLLIDGYAPEEGLRAIAAAQRAGIPVVADLEFVNDGVVPILNTVDHLVVPFGLAAEVTGVSAAVDAVNALWHGGRQAVVVTDGHHGSWFRSRTSPAVSHVPAWDVEVVDTTGCGDVFHGAYALEVARGSDVHSAVVRASAAAAICATGLGGRGRLPTPAGISALLARPPLLSGVTASSVTH